MKTINLHKKFQPLFKQNNEIRYIIISGSRGNGKSFSSALYLANKFLHSKKNCLYLRQTLTNADLSTIPQFLSQVQCLNISKYFKIKHGQIQNHLGAKLFFKGFRTSSNQQDSNLKSIPHLQTVLIEEATEVSQKQFEKLNLSLRDKDSHPKIILCFNPSNVQHWIYKRFFLIPNVEYDFNGISNQTLYIHGNYLDNLQNLDQSFIREAEMIKQINPLRYANDFLGKWLSDNTNALWSTELLNQAKLFINPPIEEDTRYFLGVDIAVTTNKDSDQTSLCLLQKNKEKYFVLDCIHGKFTPQQWSMKCKELIQKYRNLKIVAQKNQGGDLISSTLKHVGIRQSQVELVTATKSKILRAEDIILLYEQLKVVHIKTMEQLQIEMLTYSGDPKQKSPNCLDSLVWALKYASQKSNNSGSFYSV